MKKSTADYPYISPTPGRLPIVGKGPCSNTQTPTQEAFSQMSSCGFNVSLLTGPYSGWSNNIDGAWKVFYENSFSFAEKENMSIIISSAILEYHHNGVAGNWRERLVLAFRDKSNLGGWQVKDEPTYKDFKESLNSGEQAYLEYAIEEIHRLDPNHMAFCNLIFLPDKHDNLGGLNYKDFLSSYNSVFHPPVWSFDFYPVFSNYVDYNNLFKCLDAFVEQSQLSGRPFWSYVLSTQFSVGSIQYAKPTEGTLRFQAFLGLAYGAQGLVFWTYYLPDDKGSEKYILSALTKTGEKTEVWYALQQVINEINQWEYIFLNGKVETRHVSRSGQWTGNNLPLEKISYDGPGILVSTIKNGSKRFMVVVSLDPFSEQHLITYRNKNTPDTEIGKPFQPPLPHSSQFLNDDIYISENRTLKPGGYMLFSVL